MTIQPIAYIHTDFKEKFGIPRQSGRAKDVLGKIVFNPPYGDESAFRGLQEFSHIWLIFDFSKSHRKDWSPTVRPPRLGGNTRIGVFATRSPFRPNSLGLSCVKLLSIEKTSDGIVLNVAGADLLDGTPIIDIKPYIPYADCIPDAIGSFAEANKDYKLSVVFPDHLLNNISINKRAGLIECLEDDPRPAYKEDSEKIYSMRFDDYDIRFIVQNGILTVLATDKIV